MDRKAEQFRKLFRVGVIGDAPSTRFCERLNGRKTDTLLSPRRYALNMKALEAIVDESHVSSAYDD